MKQIAQGHTATSGYRVVFDLAQSKRRSGQRWLCGGHLIKHRKDLARKKPEK